MNSSQTTSLDKEFHIERYWKIIRPRLHILVICALVALVAGVVKSFSITPRYRAEGTLMIAPEQEGTISFNERLGIARPSSEYFNTQVRILRSRSLAKRVIEEMSDSTYHRLPSGTARLSGAAGSEGAAGPSGSEGAADNPGDIPGATGAPGAALGNSRRMSQSVGRFLSSLEINPLRDTRLVNVGYTSLNPQRAANLINTLFAEYIEFNLELKSQSTRRTSEFLNRQMASLQRELGQKEEELQNYSQNKDLFYLNNEENAEMRKYSDLNNTSTQAEIDRLNKETLYRELKGKSFADFPAVRTNALINSLKTNYSNLEADYMRRSETYRETYPEMIRLKSQLDTLKRRIDEESRLIADQTLKEAKTEYDSAVKKEESLKAMLNNQKKDLAVSNSNAIHYNSLSIEVENMRNLLNFLDRKHKETLLASSDQAGSSLSNIRVIDPADPPRRPINTNRKVLLLASLMMGFGAGLVLIFLLDFVDRTVKTPEDVKALMDVPVLGVIPASTARLSSYTYLQYLPYMGKKSSQPGAQDIELINFKDPGSPLAECYRNIRTSILLSTAGHPPRIITVSSARPSEGKTSTAINLAVAFHQLGKKVLLIDGDMRKPRLHKIFRLKNTVGLSSFLVGRAQWSAVVKQTFVPNLSVITSGPIPPNPVELLDSRIMESLLKEKALPEYDVIFFDAPPFIDIVDPILLAKQSDGLLLVTWSGKTNRNVLEKVRDKVNQFDIKLLGLILNKVNYKDDGYGYSYAYQYGLNEDDEDDGPPTPAAADPGKKEKKILDALNQRSEPEK